MQTGAGGTLARRGRSPPGTLQPDTDPMPPNGRLIGIGRRPGRLHDNRSRPPAMDGHFMRGEFRGDHWRLITIA